MSAPVFVCAAVTDAAIGDAVVLTGGEARHAATVQRREAGERIDLVDGLGRRAVGRIVTVGDGEIVVAVEALGSDDDPVIVLVQALAKGGRDEQAIESATELGVTRLVPWAAERAIVQWRGPKADKGRAAWLALAVAATKQSRRALVPTVDPLVTTRQLELLVADAVATGARVLVLHEVAETALGSLAWSDARQPTWLIVGPEGGISDREVAALVAAGGEPVLLGPHVLRASSAGPAAIAALAALRGTWSAAPAPGAIR